MFSGLLRTDASQGIDVKTEQAGPVSQEFLSPQNTDQLVHNPLWRSVWHARGD